MINNLINNKKQWFNIIDIIAIFSWSILLFKYWVTGQLYLLIHPNYFLLVLISSIVLLLLAIAKIYQVFIYHQKNPNFEQLANSQHSNLLPKGWGSSLLIAVAVLGLIINPMVLNSQTAMQRGVTDTLPPTTLQTQSFLNQIPPEKRSLIEWVRTLNVYPEPDNYIGQPANITGFVVHLDHLPENYIYLSRFVLTCCAVDAYPVGILVELPDSRNEFPPDSWLEVQGLMNTVTLPALEVSENKLIREKRQLVLQAQMVKTIPTPSNPYAY
ncbi:TIGR03943 family putative permease subunit [Cyanobacterium sp. Dongsha4]|uniref:TIGR03943 family putative permease subunit n=1 Tax=Cyanobacterium sp. DS4 TaxID=2878255 RepID=UPI002E7FCFBB|nr:TIGR03943 family protein [Cyanobacterium sp. Dongsha4]WVK98984.1 TIGR03943 family protein [Cyanobacterium sp. Dongsha4]